MKKETEIYHVEPPRTAEKIVEMKWSITRGNKGTPKRQELAERNILIFFDTKGQAPRPTNLFHH